MSIGFNGGCPPDVPLRHFDQTVGAVGGDIFNVYVNNSMLISDRNFYFSDYLTNGLQGIEVDYLRRYSFLFDTDATDLTLRFELDFTSNISTSKLGIDNLIIEDNFILDSSDLFYPIITNNGDDLPPTILYPIPPNL